MLKQLGKGVGKPAATLFAAAGLAVAAAGAYAQQEQFIPANFYWVGPYAPGVRRLGRAQARPSKLRLTSSSRVRRNPAFAP